MRHFLFLLGLVFLLATDAQAEVQRDYAAEVAKGQQALNKQDYSSAYEEYLRVAKEKDNPLAQFTLALFYDFGWGRAQDRAAACEWYAKAAPGHIPAAQHFHADCLRHGINDKADPVKAAQWYRQAADNGYFLSLCSLAELYIAGEGVPRDTQQGLALCDQAASKGLSSAMLSMSRFYLSDDPALKDESKAHHYLLQAARFKNTEAQFKLGVFYRDGITGDIDVSSARHWFELAAASGHVPAYYQTGVLYFNAPVDPVAKQLHPNDLAKAYLWLSAASKRSDDKAELQQTQNLLNQIARVMPRTWLGDLDAKLAEHLALYPSKELGNETQDR